jgi:RNA polymerase sigma factor (sigma-70 family)
MNSILNFAKYIDHPYYQDKMKCAEILRFEITDHMTSKTRKHSHTNMLDDLISKNPIIKKEALWMLFLKYNLLKKRLKYAQERLAVKYDHRLEVLINGYTRVIFDTQNCIANSNIRLAYLASKSLKIDTNEHISTAYMRLLRCIEMFDVSKGFAFTTYATTSIYQSLRSEINKETKHKHNEIPEHTPIPRPEDTSEEMDRKTISQLIRNNLTILDRRESTVIRSYFGIDCDQKNLEQIGKDLRLSKEYIRQVKTKALKKLRNNMRFAPV